MRNAIISILLITYLGCTPTPEPKEPVEVRISAQPDMGPYLAAEIAKSTVLADTSPETPDTPLLSIGDKCPAPDSVYQGCGGTGWDTADGTVKVRCVKCGGDGTLDAGDPLLDSQIAAEEESRAEKLNNSDIAKKNEPNTDADDSLTPQGLALFFLAEYLKFSPEKQQECYRYFEEGVGLVRKIGQKKITSKEKIAEAFDSLGSQAEISVWVEGNTYYYNHADEKFYASDKRTRLKGTYPLETILSDHSITVCRGDYCTQHKVKVSND